MDERSKNVAARCKLTKLIIRPSRDKRAPSIESLRQLLWGPLDAVLQTGDFSRKRIFEGVVGVTGTTLRSESEGKASLAWGHCLLALPLCCARRFALKTAYDRRGLLLIFAKSGEFSAVSKAESDNL